MKKISNCSTLVRLSGLCKQPTAYENKHKKPRSQFQEVWQQISSDPVSKLPQQRVSF